MTYDAAAKKLAIKAIGTVESGLNYRAVNSNDPITVGFMQWYGTRAAALLNKIRTDNPTTWVGVEDSITDDLNAHSETSASYWTTRYLTAAEVLSIREVLNNNKAIQNTVATTDIDAYVSVATNIGIDKDGNTDAMLYFFTMYHQSPRRALAVVASAGPQSNINRLHAVCLNEPVLGNYRTRYNTALAIIKSHDTTGIDDTPDSNPLPDEPVTGDTGSGTGLNRAPGAVAYARTVGDALHIQLTAGRTLVAVPDGRGTYLPAQDAGAGSDVAELPAPTPEGAGWLNHDNVVSSMGGIVVSGGVSWLKHSLKCEIIAAPALGVPGRVMARVSFAEGSPGARAGERINFVLSIYPGIDVGAGTYSYSLGWVGSDYYGSEIINIPRLTDPGEIFNRIAFAGNLGVAGMAKPTNPLTNTEYTSAWFPSGNELRPPDYPTDPVVAEGDVVTWIKSKIGAYNYSQGAGRLLPDASGYTDCSGLVYTAYMVNTGINIGTYTGNQYLKGQLVTQGSGTINESLLKPGDLIFYNWKAGRPTVDHVEMYVGNGQVCGHPGPGKGPTLKPVTWGIATASNYYVRRHLV